MTKPTGRGTRSGRPGSISGLAPVLLGFWCLYGIVTLSNLTDLSVLHVLPADWA
jgi:hypothetical protein